VERTEPEFDIRVSLQEDAALAIVVVCGDVDIATSVVMRRRVRSLISEGLSVTLDLGQVGFMDVSGIQVLVDLVQIARSCGTGFSVANPSRAVLRVADLTRAANCGLWSQLRPESGSESGN